MDTGRLGYVRRQENSRRKFMFMLNEVMRSQYRVVDECLSREKFEIGVKYDKSFVAVRRSVVKQRVLQQCLKMKRESRKLNNKNLGIYSGKPLYAYSRDIDKFIAENHPRLRRHREAEKALQEGIDKGKILDPLKIPGKIEQYFDKNWKVDNIEIKSKQKTVRESESKDIFKNTRHILPPLRGLINPFNRGIQSNTNGEQPSQSDASDAPGNKKIESVSDRLEAREPENRTKSVDKNISEVLKTNRVSKENSTDQITREPSRGLLILPPIQQTKQMAQRQ